MQEKFWRYRLADFYAAIDSIDWDSTLSGDINEAWDNWKQAFCLLWINAFHTTIKAKRNLPWINDTVNDGKESCIQESKEEQQSQSLEYI